jgi:hypothetical protein
MFLLLFFCFIWYFFPILLGMAQSLPKLLSAHLDYLGGPVIFASTSFEKE